MCYYLNIHFQGQRVKTVRVISFYDNVNWYIIIVNVTGFYVIVVTEKRYLEWFLSQWRDVSLGLHEDCSEPSAVSSVFFQPMVEKSLNFTYLYWFWILMFFFCIVQDDIKKRELLKNPTKIEEIQGKKKFWQKLNHYNLPLKRQ